MTGVAVKSDGKFKQGHAPKTALPLQKHEFLTSEVSTLSGLSLRQMQWWDEKGICSPIQRICSDVCGLPVRVYSVREVVLICIAADLLRRGLKVRSQLRPLFKVKLNAYIGYLVTNGDSFIVRRDMRHAMEILLLSKYPFWVVDIKRIHSNVMHWAR